MRGRSEVPRRRVEPRLFAVVDDEALAEALALVEAVGVEVGLGRCDRHVLDAALPGQYFSASDLDQQSHRAVVDQGNPHAGAEDALRCVEALAEAAVERLGLAAVGRLAGGWPLAPPRRRGHSVPA